MSTTSRLLAFVLLACSPAIANAAAPPVEVTTCGQAIPRGTVGYLTADLDCTGYDAGPGAVMISRNGTFELRGHRVTGGRLGVVCGELRPDRFGVIQLYVNGRCRLIGGGGTVSASKAHGVFGSAPIITDLTIENVGQQGVYALRKAWFTNVTISGSGTEGARVDGGVRIEGSHVSGSGESGIIARSVKIFDSSVFGNGTSASCTPIRRCVDLFSKVRPKVVNTVCDTSGAPSPTRTWRVCGAD